MGSTKYRKSSSKKRESSSSSQSSSSSGSSSSQSSSSSSNDSASDNKSKNNQRQKTAKKNTSRRGGAIMKRQPQIKRAAIRGGTEKFQANGEDDFNLTRKEKRQLTLIDGIEAKKENRMMNMINKKMMVNNLQQELEQQKKEKQMLAQEKAAQEKITRNQMTELQTEQEELLRNADAKINKIQNIQKKFEEKKKNDVDIISLKGNKYITLSWNFISSISEMLYNRYLFSTISYKIANLFDKKVYEHFAFLSFFFNNSLLACIIFIYIYIIQLATNPYDLSLRQKLFSFSQEPSSTFLILCVIFLLTQIIISFTKYSRYNRRKVQELAKFYSKINVFKLTISDYNWKISNCTQLEKTQLALQINANHILSSHNYNDASLIVSRNLLLFKRIGIFFLCIGILVGQIFLIKLFIYQSNKFAFSFFINSSITSLACSVICIVGSYLSNALSKFEQFEGYFYKFLRYLIMQIIPCSYLILTKSIIILDSTNDFIDSFFEVVQFQSKLFSCSNEQLGYELGLFMLVYALTNIAISYIHILVHYLIEKYKQKDVSTRIGMKYVYHLRFHTVKQTIPYLVVYFIMICTIPHCPFITILGCILFSLIIYHNQLQTKAFFLPQIDNYSQCHVKGIIVRLLAYTIVLGTIYQIGFFSITFNVGAFISNGKVYQCGPFVRLESPIDYIWSWSDTFNSFIELITWKPLLICVLVLFILLFVASNIQIDEWQSQYSEKNKELRAIKKFYSNQVNTLEDKIQFAQTNIENLVEQDNYERVKQKKKTLVSIIHESADTTQVPFNQTQLNQSAFQADHINNNNVSNFQNLQTNASQYLPSSQSIQIREFLPKDKMKSQQFINYRLNTNQNQGYQIPQSSSVNALQQQQQQQNPNSYLNNKSSFNIASYSSQKKI